MKNTIKKTNNRILLTAAVLLLVCIEIIFSQITYYAYTAKPEKSDVIIVLGCQVKGKTTPSLSLQYRLQKALELYRAGYAPHIIVSGGQGSNEETTEASVMKLWLVSQGVDSSRILEEDRSSSTYENLKFSKQIMDDQDFTTAIIASNDFHIYRSLRLAKILGIHATGAPAPNVWYLDLYYNAREIISVVKNYILYR